MIKKLIPAYKDMITETLIDEFNIRGATSPVNKLSIEFHTKLGFIIEPGDTVIDGVVVNLHYNRPDDDKVTFLKTI